MKKKKLWYVLLLLLGLGIGIAVHSSLIVECQRFTIVYGLPPLETVDNVALQLADKGDRLHFRGTFTDVKGVQWYIVRPDPEIRAKIGYVKKDTASLLLFGKAIASPPPHVHNWDLEQVEVETNTGEWKSLTFAEAAMLQGEITAMGSRIAQDDLLEQHDAIRKETEAPIAYYAFTADLTFPGEPEVQGTLKALVTVVEEKAPYIYSVEGPMTQAACSHDDVKWHHSASYSEVFANQTELKLGAHAYLSVPTDDELHPEADSQTLFLELTSSLPSA